MGNYSYIAIPESHVSAARRAFDVSAMSPSQYIGHVTAEQDGVKTAFVVMDSVVNTEQLKAIEAKGGKKVSDSDLAMAFMDAGGQPDDARKLLALAGMEVKPKPVAATVSADVDEPRAPAV